MRKTADFFFSQISPASLKFNISRHNGIILQVLPAEKSPLISDASYEIRLEGKHSLLTILLVDILSHRYLA
jgi:hypothetical protein